MKESPRFIQNIVGAGYIGVSLFFVLSGFILAYVYCVRSVSSRRFWLARFARVYPLFIFGLLVAFPGFLRGFLSGKFAPQVPLLTPTLLHAWDPASACAWNCPGWSLSVEAFFYLLFPFLLVLLKNLGRQRLVTVALVSWGLMLVPPFIYLLVQPEGTSHTSDTTSVALEILKYNPALHLPEFVLGISSGILFVRGVRLPYPKVAALGATLVILAVLSASPFLPFPLLHNGLLAGLYAFVIMGLASIQKGVLTSRVLVLLGESSYALYLLHFPVWFLFLRLLGHLGLSAAPVWVFVVYLLGMVLASIAAHRLVELPMQRWLLQLQQSRAAVVRP